MIVKKQLSNYSNNYFSTAELINLLGGYAKHIQFFNSEKKRLELNSFGSMFMWRIKLQTDCFFASAVFEVEIINSSLDFLPCSLSNFVVNWNEIFWCLLEWILRGLDKVYVKNFSVLLN